MVTLVLFTYKITLLKNLQLWKNMYVKYAIGYMTLQ